MKGRNVKPPCAILLYMIISWSLWAQEAGRKPEFGDLGIIEHGQATGTVVSNDPRPLYQAIAAVGQEYGWVIDFEDPRYRSPFDLVDATDAKWRADHPNDRGVTRIGGGMFQSSFPEPSTITSGTAEEEVLQKLISDYNSSGNPGRFILRKEAERRYAVIGLSAKDDTGQEKMMPVVLDTHINIPSEHRSALETLNLILKTLSSTAGVKVYASMLSSNVIQEPDIVVGGTDIPARVLLLETLQSANKRRFVRWDLLFNSDANQYAFCISAASKMEVDARGEQHPRFIERK